MTLIFINIQPQAPSNTELVANNCEAATNLFFSL